MIQAAQVSSSQNRLGHDQHIPAAADPPWQLMADGAMAFARLELENYHPRPNYGFANGLPPLRRMSNRLGAEQSEENKLAGF